jgi:hypothetical protein
VRELVRMRIMWYKNHLHTHPKEVVSAGLLAFVMDGTIFFLLYFLFLLLSFGLESSCFPPGSAVASLGDQQNY